MDSSTTNTLEEISRMAYTLWQSRGCPQGSPDEDWFRAEEMVRSNMQRRAASA